ncbi:MAG: hypothetical protein KDA27_17235 [Candidatus Eisenbacteria bacterium]|uniref:Curli production assembly/transport component CsgG n=1 Tax=Eiseniibacteriota bacterium TaxID=2212470 RepID=A0A956SEC2_UNCEI|nr:hypothetical protein [Candidatus Eisenbacteria bacterium]MCB9466557.1 hypothetical protein [Candidatus Eisenbacteria bacterium]
MRRILIPCLSAALVLSSGCAMTSTTTTSQNLQPNLPAYNGPKATVAVGSFKWKVGQSGGSLRITGPEGETVFSVSSQEEGYLSGLEDMLTTSLMQSGRFRVMERSAWGDVKEEIDFGESGYVDQSTRAQKGRVKGADIIVVAAVTGWDPGSGGKSFGGGGLVGGILGGVGVGIKESHIAMDIRIIDAETAEVLYSNSIQGKSRDFKITGGGWVTGANLIGGLSNFSNTPMEKAIRTCINSAVEVVAQNTPQEYYLY